MIGKTEGKKTTLQYRRFSHTNARLFTAVVSHAHTNTVAFEHVRGRHSPQQRLNVCTSDHYHYQSRLHIIVIIVGIQRCGHRSKHENLISGTDSNVGDDN